MVDVRKTTGMVLPLPTVFDGTGEVDEPLMRDLAEWYIESGVDGFFVLGSFGQGPALDTERRKRVASVVLETVRQRVPVIIQVGTVDPYSTIELGLHAKDAGADAIGLVGPYYYSDRNEYELIEHFKMVDAAVKLPILVYNNPAYSGYDINIGMLKKLTDAIPNVYGTKIAKGNVKLILDHQRDLGKDFVVYAPAENLLPGMLVGQWGSISPPLAVAPELGVKLVDALRRRDLEASGEAATRMLRYQQAMGGLNKVYGRAPFAEGLKLRGFPLKQYPRWPTKPMPAEDIEKLRQVLESTGITLAARREAVLA